MLDVGMQFPEHSTDYNFGINTRVFGLKYMVSKLKRVFVR